MRPLRGGRKFRYSGRPLNLNRSRMPAVKSCAGLKGSHGVDEGEPAVPGDVLDDVTAGTTSEAVEPVGHAANRQRRRGVVVEGAATHEALAPLLQLDTTCRYDGLERVVLPDCRNVKASPVWQCHSPTPAVTTVVILRSGVAAR